MKKFVSTVMLSWVGVFAAAGCTARAETVEMSADAAAADGGALADGGATADAATTSTSTTDAQ